MQSIAKKINQSLCQKLVNQRFFSENLFFFENKLSCSKTIGYKLFVFLEIFNIY